MINYHGYIMAISWLYIYIYIHIYNTSMANNGYDNGDVLIYYAIPL
jgi:hypothetical protein